MTSPGLVSSGRRALGAALVLTALSACSPDPCANGNTNPLAGFYAKLAQLEARSLEEPVTILHLGDSHIAGDNFSSDLRARLQSRFGSAGRGYLAPGVPFRYFFPAGVDIEQSAGWKKFNSVVQPEQGPYGIAGFRIEANAEGETLTLKSDEPFGHAVIAYARQPGGGSAGISIGGQSVGDLMTAGEDGTHGFWQMKASSTELSLRTEGDGPVALLGWGIETLMPGIRYVSHGVGGATVRTIFDWQPGIVEAEIARLDPDLIIMGYGTNDGWWDGLEDTAYEAAYRTALTQIRKSAPGASVLLIAPMDGARFPARFGVPRKAREQFPCRSLSAAERENYERLLANRDPALKRWHEPPKLVVVRDVLTRIAAEDDFGYWDWSEVMGSCGIDRWARAEPPLAYKDRVHLTPAGAARSADALFDHLMSGFRRYRTGACAAGPVG